MFNWCSASMVMGLIRDHLWTNAKQTLKKSNTLSTHSKMTSKRNLDYNLVPPLRNIQRFLTDLRETCPFQAQQAVEHHLSHYYPFSCTSCSIMLSNNSSKRRTVDMAIGALCSSAILSAPMPTHN